MFGKVVHGDKNGRKIGFPTANILVKKFKTPLTGVFAVYAEISGKKHKAIANLGVRPTLAGEKRQLETHLFNYSGDLYGRSLKIHFIGKIRDEKKFTSLEMLKQQIQLDCEQAKAMFN